MTNFDITSFFKRTSEKNFSTTTTAAATTAGGQPSTGSTPPLSPPGLEQQQTNNGGTGGAYGNETKTSTTTDGASLLPTNAHRISYDIASVWTNTTSNGGGGTSEDNTVVHQPHTTPIAHVTSSLPPPVLPRDGTITAECEEGKVTAISGCGGSRLIDWNDHFTVYVVKGGLIRVIDRLSGSRSLLRGHSVKGQSTSYVRDMVFYNKSSDILATVGTLPNNATDVDVNTSSSTSGILIWRLYRSPDGEEVSQECLLEMRCSGASASTSEATQIAWHPSNTNIFAVSHGSKVTIVESTKLQTTPIMDETSGRSHAMCTLAGTSFPSGNVTSGQMVLGDEEGGDDGHTDVILDIAWCQLNPRYLFTCGCDGTIRAWDIVTSNCLWTIPLAGELSSSNKSNMIVTRCISFGSSSDGDGGGGGGPPPPGLGLPTTTTSSTSLLVSSYDLTCGVTTLSLFSFSTDLISERPSLSHVLDFVSNDTSSNADPSLFCLSICHPPPSTVAHTAEEHSKGVYILLSQLYTGGTNITRSISTDNASNTPLMFVLHALPMPSSSLPSDYKFVKVTPYKLLHPLLSWSTGYSIREYDHDASNNGDGTNDASGPQQLLKAGNVDLWDIATYVVQTKAVQSLQINSQQASMSSSVLSVLSGDEIGQGVTVIVPGNKTTATTSNNDESSSPMISINKTTTEGEVVEMYDMEGEEEEEGEHDDHDHHDQDNYVLPTSTMATTTAAPGGGGPFTNWLGAIAASSSSSVSRPVPAPPQPVEPKVDTSSDAVGLASGSSSSNKLLTPTEILGIATTAAPASAATNSSSNNVGGKKPSASSNATEGQKTKNKATKQNNRKSRSPARSPGRTKTPTKKAGVAAAETNGGGGSTTSSTKTQKQGNKMMTVNGASTPGQVKILKRQERATTPTPSVVAPSSPAAASTQTKLPPPPSGITAKEMEECVNRALTSTMTEQHRTLVKTLQDEMYTKLVSNMESQYKVQSNRLTQSVTSKVSSSVKEPLKEAFYSTMREVMIPAMEVTTQQMLQQVSKVVGDHLTHIQQQRTQDDATARHVVETSASVTKLVQMVESLTLEVSRLQKQVAESSATTASAAAAAAAAAVQTPSTGIAGSAVLGGVSGGPVGAVGGAGAVPPGLGGGGGHQQSRGSVHGGGIPPMVQVQQVDPYASLRQEMLTNLNRRNYEVAFTQALSSNNAEMTKFCCRNVDMFSVLGQDDGGNAKLSQPILLCILQQLGSTLGNSPPHGAQQDVKMELEWMQEIALSLNATEPSIRRHVPQVISQLLGNIETKLAQGDPALRRPLQTLLQVIRGISY